MCAVSVISRSPSDEGIGLYRPDSSLGLPKDPSIIPISQVATRALHNIPASQANNGDFNLSNKVTAGIYLGVNIIGIIRQIISIADNSILIKVWRGLKSLTHVGQGFSKAMDGMNAFGAGGLGLAGIGNVYSAVTETLPGAYNRLIKAGAGLDKIFNELQIRGLAVEDALAEKRIAIAGMANHIFYFLMGLGQIASGVTSWLSSTIANICHYASVLSVPAAHLAVKVSGVAMGVIFIIRGSFMAWRATENFNLVNAFQKKFREGCSGPQKTTSEKIEHMMQVMRDTENLAKEMDGLDEEVEGTENNNNEKMQLGKGYLDRRLDSQLLEIRDGQGKVLGKYTADGIVWADGKKTEYKDNNDLKMEYVKAVDKAIYSERLKHRLGQVIAAAMIIGGILTLLAACVFTGGLAPLIIGLISAVFFTCMEGAFMSYDSSAIFGWLRDKLYSEPQWMQEMEGPDAEFNASLEQVYLDDVSSEVEIATEVEEELPGRVQVLPPVNREPSDENLGEAVVAVAETTGNIAQVFFGLLSLFAA